MTKVVKLPQQLYQPIEGNLGLFRDGRLHWYFCRERFHAAQTHRGYRRFAFCCKASQRKHVRKFIAAIEDRLKLRKKDRLKIRDTDNDRVLFIQTGAFWSKRPARDLLTILLRAGRKYRSSVKNVLSKGRYLRSTKDAVEMFLDGHTRLRCGVGWYGWRDTFRRRNKESLKQILAKGK